MPRKKTQKITKKAAISPATTDSQRKSLIAGVIILLGLALIFGIAAYKKYNKPAVPQPTPTVPSSSPTSIPPTNTTTPQTAPSLSPTGSTKSTETQTKTQEKIVKKLPLTAKGDRTHRVKEGETLTEIGKRYCNDDRAYLTLIEKNNLIEPYTLHVGDLITIACPTY